MKRKIVSMLLCVAMATTLLVGCGGANEKKESSDSGKPFEGEK